jgi:crotonobetaine/carnitine-CoA ligase
MRRLISDALDSGRLDLLLPARAAAAPDSVWLMSGTESLTFEDCRARVEDYAGGFYERGVRPGDVVTVMLDSGIDIVLVILALLRLGAIHVPVNTAFTGAFLTRILGHAEPSCVVVDTAYLNQLVTALPPGLDPLLVVRGATGLTGCAALDLSALVHPERPAPPVETRHDDLAAISYTSGTLGRSKGVLQTHRYWLTATAAMSSGRDIRDDDVFYSCTPLFHSG